MLFALAAALLLLVLAGISLPLLFSAKSLPERAQYDRAVYRDQLREVERDVARGVLNPAEAAAARLEIQRRLLAVTTDKDWSIRGSGRSPIMAAAAAIFVIASAGGLYWRLGAPGLPDAPFANRPPSQAAASDAEAPHVDMRAAAESLEKKLAADPSSAERWVLYARTVSMMNDWDKARNAYKHAIDLGDTSADVFAGFGEMLVMASQGIVDPEARKAFTSALKSDSANDVARYYLGLADAQAGDVRKAIAAWLALAADVPEDSPMREAIARGIADAARSGGIEAPPLPKGQPPQPKTTNGPSPDQIDAAADLPPAERDKMIGGMIEKLATRLQSEPGDIDGWLRLGRAYAVQGQSEKAVDAYDRAARLRPEDPTIKLQAVGALLSQLQASDPLPARAVAMLRDVAAVAPGAPEVLWYLGIVAARDGKTEEARQNWTRLLGSLTEGGEDYKMVKAALAELKSP